MPLQLLPFRTTRPASKPAHDDVPDAAVAALPQLTQLRDTLRLAITFRDACRAAEARMDRWAEPQLFFFHRGPQLEWTTERPPQPAFPGRVAAEVGQRHPAAAAAWHSLPDLIAAAEESLHAAVEVRHMARAIHGLLDAAKALAPDNAAAARLAGLLTVTDDEIFLVLHPATGTGWRVRIRGVADLGQFHDLLAESIADDVPGEPRYQLYRPQAILSDGTLPEGLAGCEHWLWSQWPLSRVPKVNEERVIILGDALLSRDPEAEPRFPSLPASVDVLETLTTVAVDDWLRTWAGGAPKRRPAGRVRVAA